jgi:hypothetical protein
MKAFILFAAILLLGSCIPYSTYKSTLDEFKSISSECTEHFVTANKISLRNKEMIDEIKRDSLKRLNKMRRDREDLYRMEVQINKRMECLEIKSELQKYHIAYMNIHLPYFGDNYYKKFMKDNPCRNPDIAKNTAWLSKKEKELYFWLNCARMYPREFCDTFIRPLLNKPAASEDAHLITLIDYMYEMKPLNALVPDKIAFDDARCHALNSGKDGYIGQVRFKGCNDIKFGECISAADLSARDHVIKLLLSEDDKTLKSRYACFDLVSAAGVAIAPHKLNKEILVIDFTVKQSRVK